MNLSFFALRDDFRHLFEYLWQETDCQIAESYSTYDHDLRWFHFFEDLERAYAVGENPSGSSVSGISLVLWSPSVMPIYRIERIELDRRRVKGHTHRYRIHGSGLISLLLGGRCGNVITRSQASDISEKRARHYGTADGVEWDQLRRLGRKIDYHVRRRMAVASTSRPSLAVLPAAYQLVLSGTELKETDRSDWTYRIEASGPAA